MNNPTLKRVACILLIFFCLPLIFTSKTGADDFDGINEEIAVMLIIDISASMARTDPGYLREEASHILIDLLGEDDYLGVVTFNNEAKTIIPLQEIGDTDDKERIKNVVSQEVDPAGSTDFSAAFLEAEREFSGLAGQNRREYVVFLTDGDPNPEPSRREEPGFMESYMDGFWNIVERFSLDNRAVYSIGFGEVESPEIIEKISGDTRGEDYLLESPEALANTFFNVIGEIKNRTNLAEELLAPVGGRVSLDFLMDDYSQQVNMLFLNIDNESFIELKPPGGGNAVLNRDYILTRGENYALLILKNQGEDFIGQWRVEFNTSNNIEIFADADKKIKIWLEQPAPYSQHPLYQDMEIKVRLGGIDRSKVDGDLYLEARVKKPNVNRESYHLLEEHEGYFIGKIEGINTPGDYIISIAAFKDDYLVTEVAHRVSVVAAPAITEMFPSNNLYPVGEELLVAASLNIGNRTLFNNPSLQVDSFQFVLSGSEGENAYYPLNDGGLDGDIRANDGIWSYLVELEDEGEYEGILTARGRYGGEDFFISKSIGMLEIAPLGKVEIIFQDGLRWGSPGRSMKIPLYVKNHSKFSREVFITIEGLEDAQDLFKEDSLAFEPGEEREAVLLVNIPPGMEDGVYNLQVDFSPGEEGVVVEPGDYLMEFQVVSGFPALLLYVQDIYNEGKLVVWGFVSALILLLGFFVIGSMLYLVKVLPYERLGGRIDYSSISDDREREQGSFNLDKFHKDKVVLSIGEGKGDFQLKGMDNSIEIIFEVLKMENKTLKFTKGWKALAKDYESSSVRVRCTPPGIIQSGAGEIFVEKDLFHGEEFFSGGYYFKYSNSKREKVDEKLKGKNILNSER